MARVSKLTDEKKDQILASVRAGMPVAQVAEAFGYTIQYVYKLVRLAPAQDDLSAPPQLQGEELINSLRTKLDHCGCLECNIGFQRYTGERNKYFCSPECYGNYCVFSRPKEEAERQANHILINRKAMIERNKPFFPNKCWVCECEEGHQFGFPYFCSDGCKDRFGYDDLIED